MNEESFQIQENLHFQGFGILVLYFKNYDGKMLYLADRSSQINTWNRSGHSSTNQLHSRISTARFLVVNHLSPESDIWRNNWANLKNSLQ